MDATTSISPALLLSRLLRQQVPQRQVIHNILYVLDPILEPIALPTQDIVLEVEDLKASMNILDELIDEQRALVVAERDRIARKTGL
jgi:hypothetical protein